MLISNSFICDLRHTDENPIPSTILASNLADALWEHAYFLVSCSPEVSKLFSWTIYVIDTEGIIHNLMSGDFSFQELRKTLDMLKNNKFAGDIVSSSQNPLCTTIDLCSFNRQQQIQVFISSDFPWDEEIEKTLKRVQMTLDSNNNLKIIVVGDQTQLATEIASLNIFQVIQFQNCEDCLFQYFRTIAENLIFPPINDLLEVSSNMIQCQRTLLTIPSVEVGLKDVCKCHNLPIFIRSNIYCSVTNKKLKNTKTQKEYSIGNFLIPWKESEICISKLVAKCRILASKISESFIVGTTQLLQSDSPKFIRLINELRCHKEVIIAKRIPSLIVGGEYWVLSADLIHPIIHCKRIANRNQLMKFESALLFQNTTDICPTPILTELPEADEVSPFLLGRDEIYLQ